MDPLRGRLENGIGWFPNSVSKHLAASFCRAKSRPPRGPVRKWVSARSPEVFDELADHATAIQQAIQQALQLRTFPIPLAWDLVRNALQLPLGESLDPRKPWSEVIPRFDPLIDIIEPVHSPQRRVGETPLARIEAVSKVDKRCGVFPLAHLLVENNLSAISVAGPLVESEQTSKLSQVSDAPKHCRWHPVQDLASHQGRTKLKPRTRSNRPASEGEGNSLLQNRLLVHEDNHRLRHTEPDHPRHPAGQVVIGQHSRALWIAHELGHEFPAVIGQHDARLGAAANLGDVCDCRERHVSASAFLWWSFLVWTPFLAAQGAESTRIRVLSLT